MQHDIYATLGASNHSNEERDPNDYYATDPKALELLMEEYADELNLSRRIWEPAAGEGHLAEALRKRGRTVCATDIIERGYKLDGVVDFFSINSRMYCDIVTNPPYSIAKEFVEHALDIVDEGRKVLMFLRLLFLESKKRKELFEKYPPAQSMYRQAVYNAPKVAASTSTPTERERQSHMRGFFGRRATPAILW